MPIQPETDLTRVSVGSHDGSLCVGVETAAASTASTMFQLLMREPNEDDAGGLVTLEVQAVGNELESVAPGGYLVKTSSPAPDAQATLSEADLEELSDDETAVGPYVTENAVSGANVHQRGNLVSVDAPWDIFDPASRPLLRDFEWQVIAWYTPPEADRLPPDLQFLDCAPEFPYRVSLNERRRVEVKGNVAANC